MTVRPERAHGLGRGLSTLIPQRNGGQPGATEIAIDRIRPNPNQPRRRFEEALPDTVRWYLSHRDWWERVRSGAYREYYERQYGHRVRA